MILALEKSISGCAAMKRFSISCFCSSSLVGRPRAFCCCGHQQVRTTVGRQDTQVSSS